MLNAEKKNYVLQHGSIKLDMIRKLSGKNTDFEDAKINLKKMFEGKLKINFLDYTLTDDVKLKVKT